MDKIFINDLLARCNIGVREEERKEKQDVIINLSLYTDLEKAGKSDRLEDTVNYSRLKGRILDMAESSRFKLIETLAERIAGICLANSAVKKVKVSVEKPGALRFARSAAIEITRDKSS